MFDLPKLEHFNKAAKGGSPDKILKELKIKPDYNIADIGSGGGYYTIRFAELLGDNGKVYAIDIEQGNLDYIDKILQEKHLENKVTLVHAEGNSSDLPDNTLDLLFLRNSFHHLKNRVVYFKALKKSLKDKGKVVIIDHKKESSSGPGIGHGTGEGEIEEVMKEAGFSLDAGYDYLPGQWFFIYKKE